MSWATFSFLTWQGLQENTSVSQSDRSGNMHFSGTFLTLSNGFTVSDNQLDTTREITRNKKIEEEIIHRRSVTILWLLIFTNTAKDIHALLQYTINTFLS